MWMGRCVKHLGPIPGFRSLSTNQRRVIGACALGLAAFIAYCYFQSSSSQKQSLEDKNKGAPKPRNDPKATKPGYTHADKPVIAAPQPSTGQGAATKDSQASLLHVALQDAKGFNADKFRDEAPFKVQTAIELVDNYNGKDHEKPREIAQACLESLHYFTDDFAKITATCDGIYRPGFVRLLSALDSYSKGAELSNELPPSVDIYSFSSDTSKEHLIGNFFEEVVELYEAGNTLVARQPSQEIEDTDFQNLKVWFTGKIVKKAIVPFFKKLIKKHKRF